MDVEYTQSFQKCKYISKRFFEACKTYDIDKINYLLKEYGNVIDINYKNEDSSNCLIEACGKNNYKLVECLINNFKEDIDIDHYDKYGNTALNVAQKWCNRDIIELIEKEFYSYTNYFP